MTHKQERAAFAEMTRSDLEAYHRVLNYSRNTLYTGDIDRLLRHREMVAEELSNRE